jgi:hypothetical protein
MFALQRCGADYDSPHGLGSQAQEFESMMQLYLWGFEL